VPQKRSSFGCKRILRVLLNLELCKFIMAEVASQAKGGEASDHAFSTDRTRTATLGAASEESELDFHNLKVVGTVPHVTLSWKDLSLTVKNRAATAGGPPWCVSWESEREFFGGR
jgi:hypothetical protein